MGDYDTFSGAGSSRGTGPSTQGNTSGIGSIRPGGTPARGAESPTKTVGLSPNSTAGANAGRRPVVNGYGNPSHFGASPYPGTAPRVTASPGQRGPLPSGVAGGTVYTGGRDTSGVPAPAPPASRKAKVNQPTGTSDTGGK
jgi:hypothetical protein